MTTLRRRLTSLPRLHITPQTVGIICITVGLGSFANTIIAWTVIVWTQYTLYMAGLSAITIAYLAFWLLYRAVPRVRAVCKRMRGKGV